MPSKARISKVLVTLDQQREARGAARRPRGARAGLQAPDRVPEGDGVLHADAARGGVLRRRCGAIEPIDAAAPPALRRRADAGERSEPRGVRLHRHPACSPGPAPDRRRHDGRSRGQAAPTPRRSRSRRSRSRPQRLEAARKAKIDRSRYEIVQDLDRLRPGSRARAISASSRINTETIGEDPMQAALCGIALAVAPNEACYVPLAHRKAGNGDGAVRRRTRARPDFRRRTRSPRSSRCSKTRACSRSART